jgi:hypothetical protein
MDEQEKSSTILKDLEIENMQQFLLENQDIKLENLPRYEDMITPQPEVELKNMQEINELPFFETKPKPKEEPKPNAAHQKRFKIAANCFAVVGVLLSALALINGVSLALLQKEITDNNKDIATLTEQVTELQQQDLEIDSSLVQGGAEKVRYKLALPRNYPDNTADLTWFDKLSIFLMKLFG